MKRSDMVIKMTEHWLGLFPNQSPEDMEMDWHLFDEVSGKMSSLLEILEYLGMKPPKEEVCPVLFTSKNVWEREDA
jgi:hypothetical protein